MKHSNYHDLVGKKLINLLYFDYFVCKNVDYVFDFHVKLKFKQINIKNYLNFYLVLINKK